MGKYQILRRDGYWVVMLGIQLVYYAPTKEECNEWIKENP